MKNYFIYNKSSEKMTDCDNATVDLIVAGPPYNIGTKYGKNLDNITFVQYKKILSLVMKECLRVLKATGIMVVEASDSAFINGRYVQLSGLIQSICLKNGFNLSERHINFSKSKNGIELLEDSRWERDYTTRQNAHSNCHQWMVFTKVGSKFKGGEIYYVDYKETKKHPCPFPNQTIDLFLSKYYKKGMTVLDPFMGTAGLGKRVLELGGKYIGYELDPVIFSEALKKLS